ncbi:PAS-domain containing protein [Roseibaca sp. Y0-43]|uniref:PAS-domain containing protein n=1 Tax=Roseibaca sp. Y0-43 TaxID=2816854 RepID=UPI001D0C52B0|nr:PAS-domain containing protein [Roseibaca sp. Y0-43]MCC1481323.1 PAS-domain containing protein [Roseibaca sp. Y0-43]
MSDALYLSLAIVSTSALVCGAVALLLMGLLPRRRLRLDPPDLSEQDAVFVFRDDDLVDCSDRGRQLLASVSAASDGSRQELELLLGFLEPRFADLRQQLRQLVTRGTLELQAHDGSGLVLSALRKQGLTHIRLTDTRAEGALVALDRLSFEAMREELSILRDTVAHVPVLAWRSDADGRVIWANTAYIDAFLASDSGRDGLTWPLPDIFHDQDPDEHKRLSLDLSGRIAWFSHMQAEAESGALHFATPIDLAVQTETSRREILQVLTRTFASLPTGLALFDKERRLQIFNPALVDLMGLDPLFLAARPSLEQFLYTLRELRMLPEPKDFAAWRSEIAELEQAAQMGTFDDEWCLDTGRVFQVTGRPQPGGALAFFFEDVTSDAALARSLRAEIEIGQAVFDGLQDAVIVFNTAGDTLLANARYSQIWGENPCENLADSGLHHALGLWAKSSAASAFWAELSQFAAVAGERPVLKGSVCLMDGTSLAVHARWLRPDCLMITFRPLVQDVSTRDLLITARHAQALTAPDILGGLSAARQSKPQAATRPSQERNVLPEPPVDAIVPRKTRLVQHAGSRPRAR